MESKKIAFEEVDNDNDNDNDSETDLLDEMIEENSNEDLVNIFQHFFTNDDGENIADILTGLKKSVDLQNKILHKVLNAFNKEQKEA